MRAETDGDLYGGEVVVRPAVELTDAEMADLSERYMSDSKAAIGDVMRAAGIEQRVAGSGVAEQVGTQSLGCPSGSVPVSPLFIAFDNGRAKIDGSYLGCRDYSSGGHWYVAERMQTTAQRLLYGSKLENFKTWASHSGNGNGYLDWSPGYSEPSTTGCVTWTASVGGTKSGSSFSLSGTLCDGTYSAYITASGSSPHFGARWDLCNTPALCNGTNQKGSRSVAYFYSPPSGSYSSGLSVHRTYWLSCPQGQC
jgi:hypothetical protein